MNGRDKQHDFLSQLMLCSVCVSGFLRLLSGSRGTAVTPGSFVDLLASRPYLICVSWVVVQLLVLQLRRHFGFLICAFWIVVQLLVSQLRQLQGFAGN